MRKIEYLSPSGIARYNQDPEAYYVKYLSEHSLPDEPQTQPMSIGSAFDAYCKSYIYERLFGKGHDPKYHFPTLFEAQVQSCNRDWALVHGKYAFELYKKSGALEDLMLELLQAVNVPKFEIEIMGVISGYREGVTLTKSGVTFLGKPDVFYINKYGAHVILDWKVNGYCSKYPKSPNPGYVRIRSDKKKSGAHKDAVLSMVHGTLINIGIHLEDIDRDWARQLSIYAWLAGMEIGSDYICGIDQLCCSPATDGLPYPDIRIAEHRLRVKHKTQFEFFAEAQQLWELVHSDHYFRNMTKEESASRCLVLDQQAKALLGTGSKEDLIFEQLTKSSPRFR